MIAVFMNEWTSEWMNEPMNECMNEWMNKWMNEKECLNLVKIESIKKAHGVMYVIAVFMNEWMNEWMNE